MAKPEWEQRAIAAEMGRQSEYEAYIGSGEWRGGRSDIPVGARCYCCDGEHSTKQPLERHHVTYQNFGHEKSGDIVLVCRVCHLMIHEWLWNTPVRKATEDVKRVRQGPMKQPAPKGFDRPRAFDPAVRERRSAVRIRRRRRNDISRGRVQMTFGEDQSMR